MRTQKKIPVLAIALLLMGVGVVAAWAQGGGGRGDCSSRAGQTLENLDQWVVEYERQMAAAEPVLKPKYAEWIRELTKLRKLVAEAKEKLDSQSSCPSDECVEDQCSLVDIADQQVAQLVKETEQQLGGDGRFGDGAGRDVLLDEDTLGYDEILGTSDPYDARSDSYSSDSDSSDVQSDGRLGGSMMGGSGTPELPPENPLMTASPE